MKYFETCYIVNKPIDEVFDVLINIPLLHERVGIFGDAYVTENDFSKDQVGKEYSLVNSHGDIKVRCILKLEKIEKPFKYKLSYSYETKDENGNIEEGCSFIPWDTMTCSVSLNNQGNQTSVTTIMYANGVSTFFGKLTTKVIGVVNYFQQQKYNKRIVSYINGN